MRMITPTNVPNMKKPQNERASEYCPYQSFRYHRVFARMGASSTGMTGMAASSAGTSMINPLIRKIASAEANGPVTRKPYSPQRFPNPGVEHAELTPKINPNGKAMMAQTSKTKM